MVTSKIIRSATQRHAAVVAAEANKPPPPPLVDNNSVLLTSQSLEKPQKLESYDDIEMNCVFISLRYICVILSARLWRYICMI